MSNIERLFTLATEWAAAFTDARTRIAKAHASVLTGGVTYTGGGEYHVMGSDGGGPYVVSVTQSTPTCTCADHTYRGSRCYHIWAASLWATAQDGPAPKRRAKTSSEQLGEVTAKHHQANHKSMMATGGVL
jgi:hypothetical protein